jgi:sugar lactone lactonase YvrE
MEVSVLYKANCLLAEGPYWHAERKSFFWVDIEAKILFEYDWKNGSVKKTSIPYRVSMIVQDEQDNIILGVQGGLAAFNLNSGSLTWLINIEKEFPDHRCNDGKCDPDGRLWVGTMDKDCKEGEGSFYCIDEDLRLHKKLDKLSIPNGLAWSLDNKRLYHTDSPSHEIKSYFFETNAGDISLEKTVVKIPDEMGQPDGMTIDEEGMLWIAHWGGSGIYRWNPENGKLLDKVEVPAQQVTSCVFGGEELDHLVITTASTGLSEEDLKKYPLSGSIFITKPGVKGIPANKFKTLQHIHK